MNFEKLLNRLMLHIPYIRYAAIYRMNEKHRPGHYYSPVVSLQEISSRKQSIWAPKKLEGIDLNEDVEAAFLKELINWSVKVPFPEVATPGFRYYFSNSWFPHADG